MLKTNALNENEKNQQSWFLIYKIVYYNNLRRLRETFKDKAQGKEREGAI
jgi:hypothetical protein